MNTTQHQAAWESWKRLLDKPRVYVDLNSGGRLGNSYVALLDSRATIRDLDEQGIHLREGLALDLWTDDGDEDGSPDPLVFHGLTHFDQDLHQWTAVIQQNDFRHSSEGRSDENPAETVADVQSVTISRRKSPPSKSETLT